jgi:hypothetical protein
VSSQKLRQRRGAAAARPAATFRVHAHPRANKSSGESISRFAETHAATASDLHQKITGYIERSARRYKRINPAQESTERS